MPRKDLTIDRIIAGWEFNAERPSARLVKDSSGREVLQLRVDLGVLQMEVTGRPDGSRPYDHDSLLEWIARREDRIDPEFKLSIPECIEVDREFSQYYHRRIGWIELKQFARAAQDATHTLALMDACLRHAPDQNWAMLHEQHRPFVVFQRAQSLALHRVQEDGNPAAAIEELNAGLKLIQDFYDKYELEQDFEDDELVKRMITVREELREKFEIGQTLDERLADAIAQENFELAARLRDEIRGKNQKS